MQDKICYLSPSERQAFGAFYYVGIASNQDKPLPYPTYFFISFCYTEGVNKL